MFEIENAVLGIELGSTRIKAVLLDEEHVPVACGIYEWENQLVNGIWTYSMDSVINGLQACYAELKDEVRKKTGTELTAIGAIGISGMMHGYLPFDSSGRQLAEFRTWRNTITGEAAAKLSELFGFNIPQRWTIAHLYQAILNGEVHLQALDHLTTLAGYIHWLLTGEKNVGIGEASGIFPIDSKKKDYDEDMLNKFDALISPMGFPWKIRDILPRVMLAGECAGYLTEAGANLLDPSGALQAGIPFAPCEGDVQTGMVATNSVCVCTGNVVAGTSSNAMIVLDHEIGVHKEIDMVATPSGLPVAMVHCNNCTSDINAWVNLFSEFAALINAKQDKGELFTKLFEIALEGDPDCGGLLSYNYISGEGITNFNDGRPVFARKANCHFSLANFMRTHLLSAFATLRMGVDILTSIENVQINKLYGHGGYFTTPVVGQRMLSAAMGVPISVMKTAGEGGPYGMALLAAYMLWKDENEPLEEYLNNKVFDHVVTTTLTADVSEMAGFTVFLDSYKKSLPVEKSAIETLTEV